MEEKLASHAETSDQQLLERWAAGDRGAGDALIERHFATLDRFFQGKAASEDAAEDLIQQTLLACMEARARFRAEASFKTFLLAIARNQLLMHYRSAHRGRLSDAHLSSLCDFGTSPSMGLARSQDHSLLTRALRRIPVDMQIVLELAYWEELDGAALAAVLGVSLNTAYSRVHRARLALSAALRALRVSRRSESSHAGEPHSHVD